MYFWSDGQTCEKDRELKDKLNREELPLLICKDKVEYGLTDCSPIYDEAPTASCSEALTETDDSVEDDDEITYFNLLQRNRNFRFYLFGYMITESGSWFTLVASIELVERILSLEGVTSRKYISTLIVCRLVPLFILSPFGGVLSDARDRLQSMIDLDCIGAFNLLWYIAAFYWSSVPLIFLAALLQASASALNEPCRSAVIPLLVKDEASLQKAVTLTELSWSVMSAFGSSLGGFVLPYLGIPGCFALDFTSYLGSVIMLWQVKVNYDASSNSSTSVEIPTQYSSGWEQFKIMTLDGIRYVRDSYFGPIVFLKASSALLYGATDVLNVSFSEEGEQINGEAEHSVRLGILLFCSGFGCLLGPLFIELYSDMSDNRSLFVACLTGFAVVTMGCLGIGYSKAFLFTVCFSIVKASGGSIVWIYSSLILQTECMSDMLGRVMAIDYGLATISEATSAMVAGILQDSFSMTPWDVYIVITALSVMVTLFWVTYFNKIWKNVLTCNEDKA